MGWYYTHGASRADIIAEITQGSQTQNRIHTIQRKYCSGNTMWTVESVWFTDRPADLFIGCYLLSKSRDGWGYKPMDESMGPVGVSCPLAFLEMVPPSTSPYAAGWRDRVRAYWADRAASRKLARLGNVVGVKHCTSAGPFRICSLKPLRGFDVVTNRLYRLPIAKLTQVNPEVQS